MLDELQALMSRIKKLLELDKKVKEKEDIIKLYEEVSLYFKEQEIRKDDLERIKNRNYWWNRSKSIRFNIYIKTWCK